MPRMVSSFAARASYVGCYGDTALDLLHTGSGLFSCVDNSGGCRPKGIKMQEVTDRTTNTFMVGERDNEKGTAAWEVVHCSDGSNTTNGHVTVTGGRKWSISLRNDSRKTSGWDQLSAVPVLATLSATIQLRVDGSEVHFVSESIDGLTWQRLGNRRDGKTLNAF